MIIKINGNELNPFLSTPLLIGLTVVVVSVFGKLVVVLFVLSVQPYSSSRLTFIEADPGIQSPYFFINLKCDVKKTDAKIKNNLRAYSGLHSSGFFIKLLK
jgi:hypothetical protein